MYTREAHPGELLPAHGTVEDKLAAARRLRDEAGIRREILVDDLDGTVHNAYGLMPNMSWVISRRGNILYKAMWTSAVRIEAFCARLATGKPEGWAPFFTEQVEFRPHDADGFMRLLERNGPRSPVEFGRAAEIWAERARTAARQRREREGTRP